MQRFPWLRYRCSSPATGLKREIRINYLATDKLTFDCLYSYRLSENDNSELKRIPDLKQVISRSFKFVARYSPMENLTVGTRIDYKYLTSPVRKGMLLLEDLILRVRPVPLTIRLRFCIFSTDDYDSRIYTWENDLLYTYSIPSFSGKGSRFYFMAGWKIHKNAELRIKYGILSKSGTSYGFTDTEEFKLQLKVFI